MVAQKPKTRFTYEDYKNTPEDERYELIDGELIMAAAPKKAHQRVDMRLGTKFFVHVETNDLGEVYSAPFDVYLSETNVVQPDLLSSPRIGWTSSPRPTYRARPIWW